MTDSNNGFLSTLLAMQLLSLGILIVALFNAPTLSPTDNSPLDRIEQPLAAESRNQPHDGSACRQ